MTDVTLYAGVGLLLLITVAVAFIVRRTTASSSETAWEKKRDIFTRYKEEAAQNPKDSGIQMKWGYALAARAGETGNMAARVRIYKEAAEHFRRAAELAPSLVVAWKNLGQTLYILFRLDHCEDRVVLANASAAYESALKRNPQDAAVWQQWGEDLYMAAAYCKTDEKKDELISLAKARYARAVALSPSFMEDWKRWGGTSADLDEMQAAAQVRQEESAGFGGQEAGDVLLGSAGTLNRHDQVQGAMPWELEAESGDPDKFFAETAPPIQPPKPAGPEPDAGAGPVPPEEYS